MWEEDDVPPNPETGFTPIPTGVARPAPAPEPAETSFAEAWQPARQLYGTGNVLNRWHREQEAPADPNYKLESNFGELMKDVPDLHQGPLREALADARSAEHSWAIRDNYMFEVQQNEEIAKQGWKGMGAVLAAGFLDEGAIALTLLGPTAALMRAGKIAKAVHEGSRARKIGAFALAGAAENASIEAVTVAASHTRSPYDIAYAGAFGGIFGGAAGALSRAKPHVNAPESDVPLRDPDVVGRNNNGVRDMDETIKANAAGNDDVVPNPVTEQFKIDEEAAFRQATGEDIPDEVLLGPAAAPGPIADVRSPKAAKAAAKADAERVRINERLKALADEDVEIPVRPTLSTELEKVQGLLSKARPEAELDVVAKTRQKQELTNARRHFMTVLQKEDPDTFLELGLGRNPSAEDFDLLIQKGSKKLVKRVEKAYQKELAESDARFAAIDNETAKLSEQLKQLEAKVLEPEKGSVGAAAGIEQKPKREIGDLRPEEELEFLDAPDPLREGNATATAHKISGLTSFYSRMIGNPSSSVRWMTDKLLTDHIAGDGRVTRHSANVIAEDFQHTILAPFKRDYVHARNEWMKEQGYNWLQRKLSNTERERQFGTQVTDALELGGNTDPNVEKAAKALQKVYKETKEFAEANGLEGFDQFATDPRYTPHVHNSEAFRNIRTEYELVGEQRMEGWTVDEELIYQGIRRGNVDLDPETAALVARNYADIVIKKDAGRRGQYFDMSRIGEEGYIEATFDALGIPKEDAEAFINLRDRLNKPAESERVKYARKRTVMDMSATVTARRLNPDTGEVEDVALSLKDLFERDAARLVHGYVRSVGGRAAIAEATKGTQFHITSDKAWNDFMEKSRQFSLGEGMEGDKVAKAHDNLDLAYQLLVGIPQHENDAWNRAAQAVGRWNFIGRMGQTAFAQMSEQGNIQAQFGLMHMIKKVPEIATFYSKRGADGRLTSELAHFAETEMAAGADAAMGRNFADHITDLDVVEGKFSLLDDGLRSMERVTGKAMVYVMAQQQRMLNISMLEQLGSMAKGTKGPFSQVTLDRFAAAGLSKADLDRVVKKIGKNGRFKNGKLVHPEHEAWGDYQLWLKFRRAMFRMTRQAVQENDISNLPPELHKSRLVKLAMQFRTFQVGAIQKQLLNNVALVKQNPKSLEAWAPFAYQTMWAGLAYTAMTELKGIGKDDKARKEWREKMLTPERIASAAFARAGFATLMPGAVDTALWVGGIDPVFSLSRGSGLQQNFITGNPTVQLAGNALKAARGVVAPIVNPDYKFSRQDMRAWQSVMPFSTLPGMYNLWNAAPQLFDLPTSSTKED